MGGTAASVDALPFVWTALASLQGSVLFGLLIVIIAMRKKRHHNGVGAMNSSRLMIVFARAASAYAFAVLVTAQLMPGTPDISDLIANGFGEDRIGYLLAVILLSQILQIYEDVFYDPPERS